VLITLTRSMIAESSDVDITNFKRSFGQCGQHQLVAVVAVIRVLFLTFQRMFDNRVIEPVKR